MDNYMYVFMEDDKLAVVYVDDKDLLEEIIVQYLLKKVFIFDSIDSTNNFATSFISLLFNNLILI